MVVLQRLPDIVPYIFSLLLSLAVSYYAWQQRQSRGVRWYAVYAFAQAIWTFGYIYELLSPDLASKRFWDDFQYIGTYLAVWGGLIFSLLYTNNVYAQNRLIRLITTVSIFLLLGLALTNTWHGLYSTDYAIIPSSPFDILTYRFLPLGMLTLVYIYVLTILALIILTIHAIKLKGVYRTQSGFVALGFGVPLLSGLLAVADINVLGQRDMAPLSFGLVNFLIGWGLFRYQLFDLIPIARDVVVEQLKNYMLVFDQDNRLIDLNPAARGFLEKFNRNLIGTSILDVFSNHFEALSPYLHTSDAKAEVVLNDLHYNLRITPIYSREGLTIGKLMVLEDITARVIARESLEERAQELETLNAELTLARDKAQESERVKSQFVASVSHELRSPLNAILIFTELVKLERFGPLNDKQKDVLGKSLDSSRQLLTLINDLLDMTKIEAGMMTLTIEENVDLTSEIEQVKDSVESLLHGKSVTYLQELPNPMPLIDCDQRRIRQILLNLVSNACKFTDEGTIVLRMEQQGQDVLFRVQDSGAGIPEKDRTLIFEPFQQTETGVRHALGTGLGLPITKYFAEAHHGKIWVESEVGVGSTFFVKLPMKQTIIEVDSTTKGETDA